MSTVSPDSCPEGNLPNFSNISPKAFIKSVAIEISPEYNYSNAPYLSDYSTNSQPFIGRSDITQKFLRFLLGKENISFNDKKRGVFLVTGYRGMGKTSFVNNVVKKYKEELKVIDEKHGFFKRKRSNRVIEINISLAQKQPSEIDILKLMVTHVYDQFQQKSTLRKSFVFIRNLKQFLKVLCIIISILLSFHIFYVFDIFHSHFYIARVFTRILGSSLTIIKFHNFGYLLGAILLCGTLLTSILTINLNDLYKDSPYYRIRNLFKRCFTSSFVATANKNNALFGVPNNTIGVSLEETETINYPFATSKEIEYELAEFLKKAQKKSYEFIFIFDELDKIEPATVSTDYFQGTNISEQIPNETAYLQQIRNRKLAIITIIAGLKNFLTTAQARFIFIAGREMFDATLADVADRQSSIGSIFNFVFYVESFLKENIKGRNKTSLSSSVEEYLCYLLFTKSELEVATKRDSDIGLYELIKNRIDRTLDKDNLDSDKQLKMWKTISLIQNFVVYLTYRSNGSPKKIIKTIHEFIRIQHFGYNRAEEKFEEEKYKSDCSKVLIIPWGDNHEKKKAYLYFSYNDQYRIGFINHIYRPFLIRYGHSYKKYSDNILISTTYLFDHLLKFHPFAFSFANLELVPEVMSTNKTPFLRDHIITIVDFLSHNHLKETENGLFDYKFYSRTLNELIYISKTHEEQAAAFNFTLDEGYLVKLHVRNEIKNLREIHAKYDQHNSANRETFSLIHLNGILGDLHFFDQEYDDAIAAYADAVKLINSGNIQDVNLIDFVVFIKFKLKLGLTFEKVKSYEEALSFYASAAEDAKHFLIYRLQNGNYINVPSPISYFKVKHHTTEVQHSIVGDSKTSNKTTEIPSAEVYHTSMMSDLLQVVNQAFIAKIILEEKMGIEGNRAQKFSLSIGGFFKLSQATENVLGRSHLINANMYLIIGNMLFYKNIAEWPDFDGAIPELKQLIRDNYTLRESAKLAFIRHNYNKFFDLGNLRKPIIALRLYLIGLDEVISIIKKNRFGFLYKKDRSTGSAGVLPTRNIAFDVLRYIKNPDILESDIYTKNQYKYMATLLSNIGDCLLSMYVVKPKSSQPNKADLYHSFGPFELFEESRFSDNLNKIISDSREFFKQTEPEWSERQRNHIIPFLLKDISETNMALGDVLHCYYWAGHLYERRGRSVSHSFQLRKMLYVLRLVLKDYSLTENLGQDIIKKNTLFLKIIQQHILDPILSIAGQTSEHSDRHMVLKFNQIFKDSNNNVSDAASAYINNNISNHPDTREGISLFLYIALKLKGDVNDSVYKDFITSYNSFATQYTRFFELDMWLKYQRKILNELPNNDTHKNAQIGVLKEYVFSLISKINTFDIYGTDYVINHSIKAHAHFLMAEIIHLYKDKAKSAIQNVAKLFGFVSPNELEDEIYHYRMAKSNYELSRQLHTGGKEYRNMMDGLIYLEDDINDNAYHFGAALDRYMMVNNVFDTFIKKCDEKLSEPRNDSSSSFFDGVFFND